AARARCMAGIQCVYDDPTRQDQSEHNLASAPQLYQRAARATAGRLGDGPYLHSVTSVGGGDNIITFSPSTGKRKPAVGIHNALAAAYPAFPADPNGHAISQAL